MNLDQITTKCWILALFIRDDGERLLLGDGWYDFKDSLQHFQPNNIASDIVELQGTDGQLLAGQVRRTASQSFDGYVGDALTSKTEIENRRRQFIQFFRVRRFYKVIYIFPDGSAIQRKRGYLTDAPSVPEMWQKFPEYHVALNFEDVNYYEYSEDEQGKEIYANTALIELLNLGIGGLVWDSVGAVSHGYTWLEPVTLTGDYITISDGTADAPLSLMELDGNATQNGTPTPDAPIPISTVTGEQNIKVVGKNLFDYSSASDTSNTTVTQYRVFAISGLKPNATYTMSGQTIRQITDTTKYIYLWSADTYSGAERKTSLKSASTVTFDANANGEIYLAIYPTDTTTWTSILTEHFTNAQLELGSQATSYEAFTAQSQEINLGKNLLPIIDGTATVRGLTVTVESGVLTLNGTSTGSGIFKLTNGVEGAEALTPSETWLTEKLPITNLNGTNISIDYQSGTSPQASSAFRIYGSTSTYINQWYPLTSDQATAWTSDTLAPSCLCFFFANGITFSNYKITLQIERGSKASSFEPYFTPIELAKIGTYQDRIYKDDETSKWYIEKQIGKVILNGSENWGMSGNTANNQYFLDGVVGYPEEYKPDGKVMSDYFSVVAQNNAYSTKDLVGIGGWVGAGGQIRISFDANIVDRNLADFKTWLSTHPTTVYYALATPTTTEITDETLLEQLEHIYSLYEGVNHISITPTAGAQGTMEVKYYTVLDTTGAGYEWEPGGGSSTTTVQVNGVDNAEPIWTVTGPATNPTLTNITTGQAITWNGTVPAGQTLVVDMGNQSATLAGANVYQFISGSWITLSPGPNKLSYSATGGAEEPSQLEWNGVVG